MIFLTALIFTVLLFVVPGELLLHWLARWMARPGLEEWIVLLLLNVFVFVLLFVSVRFTTVVIFDVGWERGRMTRRLAELLDVRGWRWLNLIGLVAVGTGAAILALEGRLPYPFWFLFAAITLGLFDLLGVREIVPLPAVRPFPRFDPAPLPAEAYGKRVSFTWEFWRAGQTDRPAIKSQEFILGDDEYSQARSRERFPRRPVQEYLKYVRLGFSPSIQRVTEHFRDASAADRLSSIDEVMNVVGFARGIEYRTDEETRDTGDYANFPIETLYDQAGDCEDHAILAATVLHNLGHDVGLFHLDLGASGHLALGYRPAGTTMLPPGPFCERADDGREYYYVETVPTAAASGLGEIDDQFLRDMEKQTVFAVT